MSEDFIESLASTYEKLIVVEELMDAGGLLDELTAGLCTLTTRGRLLTSPRLYRRAVDGYTWSTLDREGLYKGYGLSIDHLRQWLTDIR